MALDAPIDPTICTPLHGKRGIIDGDILVYRCAFAAERSHYLHTIRNESGVDEVYGSYEDAKTAKEIEKEAEGKVLVTWTRKEVQPVEFALQALKTTIEWLIDITRCSGFSIHLSGRDNFRYDIAITKPYKGNRDTQAKPTHWRACREYLIKNYGATISESGTEADDEIGVESGRVGDGGFICTIDKDLDQLAGWHFNWVTGNVYNVSRREADFNLYSQILAGDSTDNIPGLGGIGPSKARKLLEDSKSSMELFRRTWGAYRDHSGAGATVQDRWRYFLEQASLIYILRWGENVPYKSYKPPEIPEEVAHEANEIPA